MANWKPYGPNDRDAWILHGPGNTELVLAHVSPFDEWPLTIRANLDGYTFEHRVTILPQELDAAGITIHDSVHVQAFAGKLTATFLHKLVTSLDGLRFELDSMDAIAAIDTIPYAPGTAIWYVCPECEDTPVRRGEIESIETDCSVIDDPVLGSKTVENNRIFKSEHEARAAYRRLSGLA